MSDSNGIKGSGSMGILAVALVLVLAVASLVVMIPAQSDDTPSLADTNGTCGDGVVWSYSAWTRTLTISYTGEGSGRMDNNEDYRYGHFHGVKDIKTVIIEDGVTFIGNSSFIDITSIETVIMADTVTEIGGYAFFMAFPLEGEYDLFNGNTLKNITWSKNLTTIGEYAFCNVAIKNLDLPSVKYR